MDRAKSITNNSVKVSIFSSKAKTLEMLSKKINFAKILPLVRFKVTEFYNNQNIILKKIENTFSNNISLIVRSSAASEDSYTNSHAGRYKSILNVKNNDKEIAKAIIKVIHSFGKHEENDEVFVQPMLSNIALSGVVFTADIDTLAPYYIINYDESGKSDIVTSGINGYLKTYIYYKKSKLKSSNKILNKIIQISRRIERTCNYAFLDIEFAIDNNNEFYIFQVRPIVNFKKENYSKINLNPSLKGVYKKIEKLSSRHPYLLGNKTIFGIMPDWNPAEIIGYKPKQLAASLYKEIITDSIWAYQRDNYGYRNLRSHPLMITLMGIPYIDVRVDFNSFIPKDLDESIAEKLVNYYLNKLSEMPHLHDKVEFEIVHSCYYFNLQQKLQLLLQHGFKKNEIRKIEKSILNLTNKIINPKKGFYKKDLEKINILKARYEVIKDSDISILEKIYWFIEDCKRYGTLPFAGVARAAFIATQILKSFIDLKIITEKEYNLFLNSFNTITSQLNTDLYKLSVKKISKEVFIKKYGHLRPGSYDILSLRYDEDFENYFSINNIPKNKKRNFKFKQEQLIKIKKILKQNKINCTTEELLVFIKEAIEGREYAKFIFSKSLSEVLSLIEQLARKNNITREDAAFIDIKTILNFYSSLDYRYVKSVLKSDIQKYKKIYNYTKAVKLPSLILNPTDVYNFFLAQEEPNFITLKQIKSKIISEESFGKDVFDDKIVLIKSADPGFDFLFTKKIGGLITQFGGANSHMAIRCAELGIPAVIGCGEKNFNNWIKAKVLEMDCTNKQVKIIS